MSIFDEVSIAYRQEDKKGVEYKITDGCVFDRHGDWCGLADKPCRFGLTDIRVPAHCPLRAGDVMVRVSRHRGEYRRPPPTVDSRPPSETEAAIAAILKKHGIRRIPE